MAKVLPAVLELFIISSISGLSMTVSSTPHDVEEWSTELMTSPRPPVQPLLHPDFCHSGANVADISLNDCGSCHGRCGALNTMTRQEGLCSCDSACVLYGDCCWDFRLECPQLHQRAMDTVNAFEDVPSALCVSMDVQNFPSEQISFLFINSCGDISYEYPTIRGIPNPFNDVPVVDLDTGIFYINVNCSVCNGGRRLQAVGVHFNFRIGMTLTEIHINNMTIKFSTADEILEALATMGIHPSISYSFPSMQPRQCLPDVVAHCSEECENNALRYLCETGGQSYTVSHHGSHTFRNLYCALCSFIPMHNLRCSDYNTSLESQVEDLPKFSLSFLFDLQRLDSPLLDPISLHCYVDKTELPDGVVCGETVCPRGYTLDKEICRANHVARTISGDSSAMSNKDSQITNSTQANFVAACEGYNVPQFGFIIHNGSLILTSDNQVYHNGEFFIDNSSAVVCKIKSSINLSADSALGITAIILCSLSLLCLSCRLILQCVWKKYQTFPGRMQFHFTLATTLAFGLAMFSPLAVGMGMACFILAVTRYFASLAAVFWKTCVAGDTWRAMRRSRACQQLQETPSIKRYLLIGWLLPLILTIVPLSIDLSKADTDLAPGFGGSGCWITRPLSLVFFFYVPFFISIITTVTLLVLTVWNLKTAFKESRILQKSKDSQHSWQVYAKLLIVMGLGWNVGFVAMWLDSTYPWILFVILNSSQGIFLFLAFVVDWP